MKTGKNKATNNFIIRMWSKHHYNMNNEKYKAVYSGSVTEVQSKKEVKFHSPAQLLQAIEKLNKECEIERRKNESKN